MIALGTVVIFLAEFDNPGTLGPMGWAHKGLVALFTSGFNEE